MTSNVEIDTDIITAILGDIAQSGLMSKSVKTRFAPSPNGYLHQGHVLSALCNYSFATHFGGVFTLRIEDIDGVRSKAEYSDMIIQDIKWLGLASFKAGEPKGNEPADVLFQSQRISTYQEAFDILKAKGLLYRCICSRSDIRSVLAHRSVLHGPDGPHYPGTCKAREIPIDSEYCWRLDMGKALYGVPPLYWHDLAHGEQMADPSRFGDIIIWRKDVLASYHLAATCDDAMDDISHVIRGMDLFDYTDLHRLLQYHLDLSQPQYWHHNLLLDEEGEKLSKSKSSLTLKTLRDQGISAQQILKACTKNKLLIGFSR